MSAPQALSWVPAVYRFESYIFPGARSSPGATKKFFSHCFEVKGQNGFWEEVKTILMPYFQRKFPSVGEADRMRDFFLETDIYRELALLEEWIRSGMKLTPVQFADALRTSYIVYATWITEVAAGNPASQFPPEMFDTVKFIK